MIRSVTYREKRETFQKLLIITKNIDFVEIHYSIVPHEKKACGTFYDYVKTTKR